MLSRSLGLNPDNPIYMEALSGREDFPCEAFKIANEEDIVVMESFPSSTERPSLSPCI